MKAIIFHTDYEIQPEYHPQPASKHIPDWYKKIESYISPDSKTGGMGNAGGTIKKCMPVFDAITAGYLLFTPADIYVSQVEGRPHYEWPSLNLLQFHPIQQASNHPLNNGFDYPKWMNPWVIQTPKGYSTLFTQPFHHKSIFTILTGIVDTDIYTNAVNFPFVLNDPLFTGLIPAGTPMAQVIPIKRDNWKLTYGETNHKKIGIRLRSKIVDGYKHLFWQRKLYK